MFHYIFTKMIWWRYYSFTSFLLFTFAARRFRTDSFQNRKQFVLSFVLKFSRLKILRNFGLIFKKFWNIFEILVLGENFLRRKKFELFIASIYFFFCFYDWIEITIDLWVFVPIGDSDKSRNFQGWLKYLKGTKKSFSRFLGNFNNWACFFVLWYYSKLIWSNF